MAMKSKLHSAGRGRAKNGKLRAQEGRVVAALGRSREGMSYREVAVASGVGEQCALGALVSACRRGLVVRAVDTYILTERGAKIATENADKQ